MGQEAENQALPLFSTQLAAVLPQLAGLFVPWLQLGHLLVLFF